MSNRKFLFSSILGVASCVLIIILTSIIYVAETQEKSSLERNTLAWANTLAQASASFLLKNDNDGLNAELKKLVTPTDISYIHIYKKHLYKIDGDDKITYFTGFNKNIYYPSILDKIDQIEALSSFKYQNNHLELVVKIEQNQLIYGYLYIQVSTKYIDDFSHELTIDVVLLLLLGLTLFALLAYTIQKKINRPITTILESVQEVTQSKDYQQTITTLPLIEFDILAQNINFLLNKTDRKSVV